MATVRRRRRNREDRAETADAISESQEASSGASDDDRDDEDDDEDDDGGRDDPRSDEETEPADEDDGSAGRSRMTVWVIVAGAVAVLGFMVLRLGWSSDAAGPAAAVGSSTVADLTLITADRNDLDCAASAGVNAYQCGFSDEKTARQVDEQNRLRPFMTASDRRLFLIPGLFLEPAIAKRAATEPPAGKARNQLKRFTAKCKVQIVGELDGVKLRWSPTGTWEPPKKFQVATASDCKIEG